jgi:hypothetical protein
MSVSASPTRVQVVSRLVLITALMSAEFSRGSDPSDALPLVILEGELKLEAGRFAGYQDTALGEPVMVENDIDSAPCHPLLAITGWSQGSKRRFTGPILLWLHRVHLVGTRVFLEPCELSAPFASSPRVAGAVSNWWFEGTLVDAPASPRIELRRLALPGWGIFSNPTFCGRSVAFWSVGRADASGKHLTAMIADVFDGRALASRSLGSIQLETDNRWCFRPATWAGDCQAATFDASAQGKSTVRLEIRR